MLFALYNRALKHTPFHTGGVQLGGEGQLVKGLVDVELGIHDQLRLKVKSQHKSVAQTEKT